MQQTRCRDEISILPWQGLLGTEVPQSPLRSRLLPPISAAGAGTGRARRAGAAQGWEQGRERGARRGSGCPADPSAGSSPWTSSGARGGGAGGCGRCPRSAGRARVCSAAAAAHGDAEPERGWSCSPSGCGPGGCQGSPHIPHISLSPHIPHIPPSPRSPRSAQRCAAPSPPPRQSLGDIKGKEEKGYLEERVAKQPLPPTPPQSTANPKLVPGLQPD